MVPTASATAASAVVSALPGDWGTPIAEQLAQVGSAFMIVLAVLFAEKYLLPILGGVSTGLILPIACIAWLIYIWTKSQTIKNVAVKTLILAIALVNLIPVSNAISSSIEKTFETSINETVERALQSEEELGIEDAAVSDLSDDNAEGQYRDETVGEYGDSVAVFNPQDANEDSRNVLQKGWDAVSGWTAGAANDVGDFVADTANNVGEFISNAAEEVVGGVSITIDSAKSTVSKYVEAFAVILVVDCVIPILVLISFFFLIKHVFGLNFTSGFSTRWQNSLKPRDERALPEK